MLIDTIGPWNDEFFPQLHQHLALAAKHVDINNYAVLLNLKGAALSALRNMQVHSKFVSKSNAKAMAINMAECTSKEITKKLFETSYSQAKLNHAFFDNKPDAINWLNTFID